MSTETHEPGRDAAAIAISLGKEDGATGGDVRMDDYFGRRIEEDRTWTIYHVYTGVPASSDGCDMIGMSRMDATHGMQVLNTRNSERRLHRSAGQEAPHNRLSAFLLAAWRKTAGLSWH